MFGFRGRFSAFSILILLFCSANAICQTDADAFFKAGNAEFQKGNFDAAIEKYESARQTGFSSPELFVNLGHAFQKKKMFGKAILNYERARLMAPNDEILLADLALARKKAGLDEVVLDNRFFLSKWWENLRNLEPPNVWAWVSVWLVWLSAAGAWLFWKGNSLTIKRLGLLAVAVFSPVFLLTLFLAMSSASRGLDSGEAIVVEKSAALLPSPDASVEEIANLPEGSKVQLWEKIGDWWKAVSLAGEEGWVLDSAIERI